MRDDNVGHWRKGIIFFAGRCRLHYLFVVLIELRLSRHLSRLPHVVTGLLFERSYR